MKLKRSSGPVLATLLVLGLAGCRPAEVPSRWLDREIVIDGDPQEWKGAVYALDGEATVLGLINDSMSLYLCLVSSDPNVSRQVLGRGFTLWFDPSGGKERTFGIRFPLGRMSPADSARVGHEPPGRGDREDPGRRGTPAADSAGRGRVFGDSDREGRGSDRALWDPDRGRLIRALQDSTAQLEIFSGPDQAKRSLLARATGIQVRIGLQDGVLTYEARIPLSRDADHPYAVGADRNVPFGLGLETPTFRYSVFSREDKSARERSGYDPSSNDPSGGGSEPGDGPQGDRPEGRSGSDRRGGAHGPQRTGTSVGPVEYWLRVRLASDATAGSSGRPVS